MQIHSVEPLAEGSVSRFTLWVGPLPLRWTAIHKHVSGNGFTDVQESGPAKKWEHTHTFVELDTMRTAVKEHIEYEHKRGFWGLVTRLLSHTQIFILCSATAVWSRRSCHIMAQKKPC